MTTLSKTALALAISVGLVTGSIQAFAKGGSPGQVKTSGKSTAQGANPAGGPVVRRPRGCGRKTYGVCALPPAPGATSGGDPIHRGPGNPTLHPK